MIYNYNPFFRNVKAFGNDICFEQLVNNYPIIQFSGIGSKMKYEKPELTVEKFSIIENIMAEGISTPDFQPVIDENIPDVEYALGEALSNIFNID